MPFSSCQPLPYGTPCQTNSALNDVNADASTPSAHTQLIHDDHIPAVNPRAIPSNRPIWLSMTSTHIAFGDQDLVNTVVFPAKRYPFWDPRGVCVWCEWKGFWHSSSCARGGGWRRLLGHVRVATTESQP